MGINETIPLNISQNNYYEHLLNMKEKNKELRLKVQQLLGLQEELIDKSNTIKQMESNAILMKEENK